MVFLTRLLSVQDGYLLTLTSNTLLLMHMVKSGPLRTKMNFMSELVLPQINLLVMVGNMYSVTLEESQLPMVMVFGQLILVINLYTKEVWKLQTGLDSMIKLLRWPVTGSRLTMMVMLQATNIFLYMVLKKMSGVLMLMVLCNIEPVLTKPTIEVQVGQELTTRYGLKPLEIMTELKSLLLMKKTMYSTEKVLRKIICKVEFGVQLLVN